MYPVLRNIELVLALGIVFILFVSNVSNKLDVQCTLVVVITELVDELG